MTQITNFLKTKQTTSNPRFNFSINRETIYEDITACYQHTVQQSGHKLQLTQDTTRVLMSTSNWLIKGKQSLLLRGLCGTGKTKLIQALQLLFSYYQQQQNIQQNPLKILQATKITELATSKNQNDIDQFEQLKTRYYLAIDDLGIEPVKIKNWGTDINPIFDLLYTRYNTNKTTIITTNLNLEEIEERYTTRIYDRICEQYDIICFNFNSFRQQ